LTLHIFIKENTLEGQFNDALLVIGTFLATGMDQYHSMEAESAKTLSYLFGASTESV
jgi:hypothetical protein